MKPVGRLPLSTPVRRINLLRASLSTDEPSLSTPQFYNHVGGEIPMKSAASYIDYSDYTINYNREGKCKYSLYTNLRGQAWSPVDRGFA